MNDEEVELGAAEPEWLVAEPFDDVELGLLRAGKEAQIDLINRIGVDGRSCILARKRYLPRSVSQKGQLEAMGVQRASAFRHDVAYREGRQFRKSRDRRAVERMSARGKALLQSRWTGHEYEVMRSLWEAGVAVPFPVSHDDDVFVMEFVGDSDGAAPQLGRARLSDVETGRAFDQVIDGLFAMVGAGWVHGDLSAFNILWWQDAVVFIDFPQAVDMAANPQGIGYLHRDVVNICTWFGRRGIEADADDVFARLLAAS